MTRKTPKTSTPTPKKVLVLRTCKADMTSPAEEANGFKWPEKGHVEAKDWNPEPRCGHGLHGALWGEGDGALFCWDEDAKWIIVEVDEDKIVDLGGKVKYPEGEVVFSGDRKGATDYLIEHGAQGRAVIGCMLTGGYGSTLTGGYGSTLTGGDGSTLTGGDGSTLTGGYGSTLTGGDGSTLTGGYGSTLTGGDRSTLTGGYGSTLTGGPGSTLTGEYRSTLTGGYGSTLTGGDWSTLTGGDRSTLTGGDWSTLTGGDRSTLTWKWWDGNRYRLTTVYTGEDGIESGKAYRFENGKVVEVKK